MSELQSLYYLGPDGSNSYNAAVKYINMFQIGAVNRVPIRSIKAVINALEDNVNSSAVLPIENFIEGLVRETIDNLIKISDENIKIQGEFVIPIRHMLLGKTDDKAKIKKIYSHPQALAQCAGFLAENFPDAELREVSSTSYAAEKISLENDETAAAIANSSCAGIFGLNILCCDINDEKDNQTRFYILGRKPLEKNKTNKTSIVLAPDTNRTGVLCDILKIFANHGINLSYIDSRPSKKHLGEYIFFMEFDGQDNDMQVKKAVSELKRYTAFIKVLGSFSIYS